MNQEANFDKADGTYARRFRCPRCRDAPGGHAPKKRSRRAMKQHLRRSHDIQLEPKSSLVADAKGYVLLDSALVVRR